MRKELPNPNLRRVNGFGLVFAKRVGHNLGNSISQLPPFLLPLKMLKKSKSLTLALRRVLSSLSLVSALSTASMCETWLVVTSFIEFIQPLGSL